jgi:glucosylceramidase
MVLDETGKSQWGWKQNSMISIDKTTGKVTYNPEYFLMKHFSWFIENGSAYIPVAADENCLAFIKNKKVVVFYYNASNEEQPKQFSVSGKNITARLKAKSFNTIVIEI